MKNIAKILLLAVLSAAYSCDVEAPEDAFGGAMDSTNPVAAYMLYFADDLVCDNLKELETALKVSAEGGMGMMFYTTSASKLTLDGATWIVKREGNVTGLRISKVSGINAWDLFYSGKYSFSGNSYDTEYTIRATQLDPTATGHQNWAVTIKGSRTEEGGYNCLISSAESTLQYKTIENGDLWNVYGYLMMTVYKEKSQIDKIVMELAGGKSDSSIVRL